MTTVASLRRENRSRLLQHLFADGPLPRYDLAARLGLGPSAVTKVVSELMEFGLVREVGSEESEEQRRPGRPGILVDLVPSAAHVVGVSHLRGGPLQAALLDLRGQVVLRRSQPMVVVEPPEGLERIADLVREVAAAAAALPGGAHGVVGVGLGVPGRVDDERG